DLVDALAHDLGLLAALLVGVAQIFVALFEVAAVVIGDGLELLERVAELFARLFLAVLRALDALLEQLSLLDAHALEHRVVGLLAGEGSAHEQWAEQRSPARVRAEDEPQGAWRTKSNLHDGRRVDRRGRNAHAG